ncbi:DUF2628 domain-containing protein [Xanthobacter sp. AM11]|uniref:DUF2628 domain-containing protein n=1 Tax=Xanthobacter sp. AM11 TaxID=3380643 RepID=UPI0039BF2E1A
MGIWTVMTREHPGDTAAEAAGHAVFVREKFSWVTLLFAPLVLLRFRLWLVFAAYVAVAALLLAAVEYGGLPDVVPDIVMAGFHLLLAFELPGLRLRKLARLGYGEVGVVMAEGRAEAEHRFFSHWSGPRPAPSIPPFRTGMPMGAPSGVIGAFPGA